MRRVFILLVFIGFLSCNNDDNADSLPPENIFVGDVFLKTQTDVDTLAAEEYTEIDGSLFFTWDTSAGNDHIVDLSSLISLNEIKGRLYFSDVQFLNSLQGLQNITHVGGLAIFNCGALTNLDGLQGLIRVEDDEDVLNQLFNDRDTVYILNSTHLESLRGLENLVSVPSIVIYGNWKLETLEGLNNLLTITGTRVYDSNGNFEGIRKYVTIGVPGGGPNGGNIILNDLCALQNLFINGVYDPDDVSIEYNLYNPTVQDIINGDCSV